jgi:aspartate racemase
MLARCRTFSLGSVAARCRGITSAVGIAGGVGPMAGCLLHRLVIENTLTLGDGDQGHLDVYHLSKSRMVSDRTRYLSTLDARGQPSPLSTLDNPAEGMAEVACSIFAAANCDAGDDDDDSASAPVVPLVVGVPCNTFHAPPIWDAFSDAVGELPGVELVHMLRETGALVEALAPGARRVGLMSTTGTRASGVYAGALGDAIEILEVPEAEQANLHDAIYNDEWGIKACAPVTARARAAFEGYASQLVDMGAEAIVLGCTEIPLALPEPRLRGVPLVDPMLALARALVERAAPERLKPLATDA